MTTTTNELVQNIKDRSLLDANQNTISDDTILRWANDEMNQFIVPMIKEFHEEYLVVEETVDVIPGQDTYRVPQRALGGTFRTITFTSQSGTVRDLARITREEREVYRKSSEPVYFMQGSSIRIVPEPTNAATITFGYVRRPNQLVFADRAKLITQVLSNGLVTLSSAPDWLSIGSRVDVVDALYPSELTVTNGTPISIVNNKVTLASVRDVKVGDFLSVAGTTHLIPFQSELVALLEERTVLRVFTSLGDEPSVATTQQNIAEMQARMGDLIDNRASGNPTILVNHNSPMRTSRF